MIGLPKADRVVDGSLDARRRPALARPRSRARHVLYAPTWSPASSLNRLGVDLHPGARRHGAQRDRQAPRSIARPAPPLLGRRSTGRPCCAPVVAGTRAVLAPGHDVSPVPRRRRPDDHGPQLRRIRVSAARSAPRPHPLPRSHPGRATSIPTTSSCSRRSPSPWMTWRRRSARSNAAWPPLTHAAAIVAPSPRICSTAPEARPPDRSASSTTRSTSTPRRRSWRRRPGRPRAGCKHRHAGVQRRAVHRRRDPIRARADVHRLRADRRGRRVEGWDGAGGEGVRRDRRADRAGAAVESRPGGRQEFRAPRWPRASSSRCSTATTSGSRRSSPNSSRSCAPAPRWTSSPGTAGHLGGARHGEPARPCPDDRAAPDLLSIIGDEWSVFIMSVFRRRVYTDIGEFDESMRSNEDYDYWLRAAEAGFTFVRNDAPLGHYRGPQRLVVGQRRPNAARHPPRLHEAPAVIAGRPNEMAVLAAADRPFRDRTARGRGAARARDCRLRGRPRAPRRTPRPPRRRDARPGAPAGPLVAQDAHEDDSPAPDGVAARAGQSRTRLTADGSRAIAVFRGAATRPTSSR